MKSKKLPVDPNLGATLALRDAGSRVVTVPMCCAEGCDAPAPFRNTFARFDNGPRRDFRCAEHIQDLPPERRLPWDALD